jgi:hypothetical protein
LGEIEGCWLFMPSTLELRKVTYKWREARFMVFTIKPGHMPSPEGNFHWQIDESTVGASLKANTTDNFSIGSAQLVFQEEIIFE